MLNHVQKRPLFWDFRSHIERQERSLMEMLESGELDLEDLEASRNHVTRSRSQGCQSHIFLGMKH